MNRLYVLLIIYVFSFSPSFALSYDELSFPAMPASRLGTDDVKPEKITVKAKVQDDTKTAKTKKIDEAKDLTYADLSLKKIAIDIAQDLEMEQDIVLSDLAALWAAAAQNSETVKYTIYKLSNPDENKPEENLVKRIIKPIASFSTVAGTAFANNPFVASSALIGGNLMSAFSSDNKELNYKFTKINDADMVILVRKIDDLQKRLMVLYMDYSTKKEICKMAQENLKKREEICRKMQDKSREQVLIADSYYRNAQSFASKANSEYAASRSILEQLVGTKVLEQIEERNIASQD